jgi:hypothetical protein
MVGKDENILVEFDYQNIVLVDPNKTIDSQGVVKERLLKHEDLVYYANLECNLFPRTRLSVGNNGYYENKTVSIAEINFLKPGGKTFLDNGYLDEITGLNSINGNGANQIIETKNTITTKDKPDEYYLSQQVKNGTDNNLLLISQITIDTQLNLVPIVTISMEDIRGRALFEQGENSPYAVFFNYPYPLFYLTVKGYLGKAVKYQLALKTFNARFDTNSGNFKIDCNFMAYKYNVLTNITMEQIQAVPYMYRTKYSTSPNANSGVQSAVNTLTGGNSQPVDTKTASKGYEKIKEVYSEYKSKGLVDKDFPELTLTELLNRLEVLEKTILSTFDKADMTPITDGDVYGRTLADYEGEIFFQKGHSWFEKYMDTKNFFVGYDKQKFYTYKKEIIQGNNKDIAKQDLYKIISEYNKKLNDNPTFGTPGEYKVEGKTYESKIPNSIKLKTFQYEASDKDIDWEETYRQRTGQEGGPVEIAKIKSDFQSVLNAVTIQGDFTYKFEWYKFEGSGSFLDLIQIMQNNLSNKIEEIQGKLSQLLSKNLSSPSSGLGFKPTLKNVIAVVLASSEAFLRLMCDVHQSAWNERKNKYRVDAILTNDKSATSTDAKQSVPTTDGNLIPIYPWPQYFVETNNPKGEKFEITYPGDPKVVSKTKGYLYNVWPEVEFVEEFLKGKSLTVVFSGDTGATTNPAQTVNKVSLNAIDFPTTDVIFGNRQESRFMYEIFERVFLSANYQRFMRPGAENEIQDILAESEFINIRNSLLNEAPFLIQKLKQYGFNSSNFVPFLSSLSNNGTGESWQKYIRDEFVTKYIQQEIDNSYAILDQEYINPNFGTVDPQPKNIQAIGNYIKSSQTNEPNFLDTFPFVLNGWGVTNMANGSTANDGVRSLYNTSKSYVINQNKKMVANFDIATTTSETRPITNFNYKNPNKPNPSLFTGLKTFYEDRATNLGVKKQQVTEGTVSYTNYSGNVSSIQTTSMLNTPFFVNSILSGVDRWLSGDTSPYVSASYLLLNSLPIATLREKYKTYNGNSGENTLSEDLDYIFASFKKFGAIHKVPYAWVLKQGSIWHRYKKWVEDGVDILDDSWKDFDYVANYDPITNDTSRVYSLRLSGQSTTTDIVLETTTPVTTGTVTQMNLGFYPKVIDKFNLFHRGYNLFNGYTNADIQAQIDNIVSGFTLTSVSDAAIDTLSGYNESDIYDVLSFKAWNCTLIDKKLGKEYMVPSFGSTMNQTKLECFNNNNKLLLPIKSNPAVYNGSVRSFWALPNYGFFDQSEISRPEPTQYLKKIISNNKDQHSFSMGSNTGYTSNEEMLSVFNKEFLDLMEEEFLKFSKSMYEYETQQVGNLVTTRVQVDNLYLDTNGVNKNFQLLCKELLTFNIVTSSALNSTDQTNNIKTNQFDTLNTVIKNFLQYDVILKYGNPGNYDRRLFDSYATNVFIEDKVSFNYYTPNSLPTSANTTVSLATYKSQNPDSWVALETYVGFSKEPGIEYTNTGSTITDFFIDMNIEFIPESVKELAPLIKIYATQKKIDPTLNRDKFVGLLNSYITNNKKFSDGLLNSLLNKVRFGLPDIVELNEKNIDTALQGTQTKVELWETFKALNDTWIAGYDYTQTTFLEDVLLLDRGNRNLSDDILIDPFKVRNLLKNINPNASVYYYLESILDIHHFIVMMHPAYINYYNVQEVQKTNIPKIEGTLEFGNSLFGTYLNVDTRSSSPKLVCTYAAEPSKHLNGEKNDNNRFNSDSFDLRRSSDNPLTDKLEGKEDWGLSNRVVGFNVDIGIRNQNVFYYFDVSQDSGKQTSESLLQMDNLINQSNGKQVATQNVSLWNYYRSRSYQCRVNSIGNVMIQPTMYFNLRHVPMFNGPYYIMDVKHNITPGRFETTFTGIRQQVFALPKLDSYIQTLTKQLFVDLYDKLTQKPNTNSKDNPTANSNPNNTPSLPSTPTAASPVKNAVIVNTGTVDNPQNCSNLLDASFNKFTSTIQGQNSLSLKEVVDGINFNVTSGNNLDMTKMLSFVTVYLESFKNTQFTAFNNNFAGVRLNYKWPGELPKFFTTNYICNIASDGTSYPYAEFVNFTNVCGLLQAKWGPVSGIYTMDAESISKAWIMKWNKPTMSDSDFETYKVNSKVAYENVIYKVGLAINLANTLGLLTPPPPPITIEYLGEFDTVQGNSYNYYNIEQTSGKFKVLKIVDPNFNFNNIGISQFKNGSNDIVTYNCSSGSGSQTCTVNGKNPGTYTLNVDYYPNGPLNSTKILLVSPSFTQ